MKEKRKGMKEWRKEINAWKVYIDYVTDGVKGHYHILNSGCNMIISPNSIIVQCYIINVGYSMIKSFDTTFEREKKYI